LPKSHCLSLKGRGTKSDLNLGGIWTELEAAYTKKTGPSVTLTNAEGENLEASLCFDNLQKEGQRRDASQERKATAMISGHSQPEYAKVAKQASGRSGFYGGEKPFEFLEQVEWSANTFRLDPDMIPQAMPELLKGRSLKSFISNNKQWKTWAEFIESFHTYFLTRDFFTKLTDQVKQRKQVYGESYRTWTR